MNAFDRGAHAHADGKSITSNPFDSKEETEDYVLWNEGWKLHEKNERHNKELKGREEDSQQ